MKSAKSIGRTAGILLLLQLAAGLTLPFILMKPVAAGSPGFLTSAAENSFQIRAGVLLAFIGGALTFGLAVTTFPVFRRYSGAAAIWFTAVCAVSWTLDIIHGGAVMAMLSLSQEYLKGSGADAGLYQVVGTAVASARRWAHYTQLTAIGSWIFLFYGTLFRFALVPRALAALGLVGIALQFTGVTLMMFLGYGLIGELAMPMLPIQIAVAVWLIIKGFNERLS